MSPCPRRLSDSHAPQKKRLTRFGEQRRQGNKTLPLAEATPPPFPKTHEPCLFPCPFFVLRPRSPIGLL